MAKQRRGAGRRPSGGAVAGRLVGAFVAGVLVMGGGLFWFEHMRRADESRQGRTTAAAPALPGRGEATGDTGMAATVRPRAGLPVGDGAGTADAKTVPQPPFGESEEVFETGARVYAAQCAGCHGRPGRAEGTAGQYWGAGAARVAGRPAGELFQQIAGGVAPGMKGFRGELREPEMWDLALLLRNAGGELPEPVDRLLRGGGR